MPSKRSKPRSPKHSLWKAAQSCSEGSLRSLAHQFAHQLRLGDIVALEGELGAGKSTFAAAVLEGLGADRPPEGSPTFSLVHRYPLKRGGEVLHIDLYRLKSEGEIEAAGILEDLWNLDAIVLVEWLSMWPGVEEPLLEESSAAARRRFRVNLALSQDGDPLTRSLQVERL